MTDGVDRVVTESGGSLKIVIPKQLAQLYGIKNGDVLRWTQGGPKELRLAKATETLPGKGLRRSEHTVGKEEDSDGK